ncbi:hypothetical protein BX666DRAFT_1884005 [Dichotomocladium elegans]|nr:hypothetical protein BX666DRAFT_1884005 [Dichotomocladium elegans]
MLMVFEGVYTPANLSRSCVEKVTYDLCNPARSPALLPNAITINATRKNLMTRQLSDDESASSSEELTSLQSANATFVRGAIAIKNIPWTMKREELINVLRSNDVPEPYALNYCYYGEQFCGMAFANFNPPELADEAIKCIRQITVRGRQLNAEEKRSRRVDSSASSAAATTTAATPTPPNPKKNYSAAMLNYNHPLVKEMCKVVEEFKADDTKQTLVFQRFDRARRMWAHLLATKYGLESIGQGFEPFRVTIVMKPGADPEPSESTSIYYRAPFKKYSSLDDEVDNEPQASDIVSVREEPPVSTGAEERQEEATPIAEREINNGYTCVSMACIIVILMYLLEINEQGLLPALFENLVGRSLVCPFFLGAFT